MLYIHFSNRFEVLAEQLIQLIGARQRGAFATEPVLVPSAAMSRALTLALADRTGLCANVGFDFPARWLWSQIARVIPSVGATSPFSAGQLSWRVYGAFSDRAFVDVHPRLRSYIGDADPVMRYELACAVAAVFEQYTTYRDDWLDAWGHGREVAAFAASESDRRDEQWQRALWQRIVAKLAVDVRHPAQAFAAALREPGVARHAGLPERAHVFAPQAIPPLHLQLLRALGEVVELHLYVLNPCREYWFEIIDRRRLNYLAARGRGERQEEGNRLLAGWGRQTQSLVDQVIETLGDGALDDGVFVVNRSGTLLARVQDAILDLVELEPGALELEAEDRSIEVHVCHSLTRELEVLQDQLLDLFSRPVAGAEAPLEPADVLVVLPHLDDAAPVIDAVFAQVPGERQIPYTITGRARSSVNAPARALLDLLALVESRCTATALYAVLRQPIVSRRFELDDDGLERVREWMGSAGIRWALDGGHRASFDVPASERHTLARGLERLLLGFALPEQVAAPLFGDLLPAGSPGDAGAQPLGALWRFSDRLHRLHASAAVPMTAADWALFLLQAVENFLSADPDEVEDLRELRGSIGDLTATIRAADPDAVIPLSVIRTALARSLDDPARGGVPSGRVTFSSMSSLRGLPFRVVCIIGLNDEAFPAAERPAEFDLMSRHPRRGDRQRRNDQRNLFLDLVLAARGRLYLSYTGRSIRDNSSMPPSVLVAELLEALVPAIATDPASSQALDAARARLVVEHPLQPFSVTAFATDGDPRRRSFNEELAEAVRHSLVMVAARAGPTGSGSAAPAEEDDDSLVDPQDPLFRLPLPPAGQTWHDVQIEQLVEFYRNPCRYLLRHRLGITLQRTEEAVDDSEPFLAGGTLDRSLAARLLPPLLQGVPAADLEALAMAGIEMPDGSLGVHGMREALDEMREFATRVQRATSGACLPAHHCAIRFEFEAEAWTLQGAYADLRREGLVRYRYAERRATDLLGAWLHHLLLQAEPVDGAATTTTWIFKDGAARLAPPADPVAHLQDLVRLYRLGLSRPLHFFPASALEYVQGGQSLSKADKAWRRTDYNRYAESVDAAYRLALRDIADPLDAEFEDLASRVFDPLLKHLDGEA